MGRGRPAVMTDRITTTISLEKEDLDLLRDQGIELSEFVRKAIKNTLSKSNDRLTMLKSRASDIKNTIQELQIELESTESEVQKLESKRKQDQIAIFGCQTEHTCRKSFGNYYNPISLNNRKEGTEFHHMYLLIEGKRNQSIGMYIPKKLHRSIKHQSRTGNNLKEINKAALLWLCEQDTI